MREGEGDTERKRLLGQDIKRQTESDSKRVSEKMPIVKCLLTSE